MAGPTTAVPRASGASAKMVLRANSDAFGVTCAFMLLQWQARTCVVRFVQPLRATASQHQHLRHTTVHALVGKIAVLCIVVARQMDAGTIAAPCRRGNRSRASTDCSCCSLDQRGAPSPEQKYGEWHSQVLRGQHVLADAFCQGFPAAAWVDAARAALRPQVLQHQRPQVVMNLQCT